MSAPRNIYRRGRIFWIRYTARGQQVRESSRSPRRNVAEDLLKQRMGELSQGRFLGAKADRIRMDALLDGVLRDYQLRQRRGLRTARFSIDKHLRPYFTGWRVTDVTTAAIYGFVAHEQAEHLAPATIELALRYLNRAFTLGIRDQVIAVKPYVPTLGPIDNVREGFFETADFARVVAQLDPVTADLCRFGFLTGWRKQEVFGLPWKDIDLSAWTIRLPATRSKTHRGRLIGMDQRHGLEGVRAIIERRAAERRLDCPFVFHRGGKRITDIDYRWHQACDRAGLHGRLFHDFRRTAVRNLIRAGVSKVVAKTITGHRSDMVFDRYDIVDTRDSVLAFDAVLDYLAAERTRKPAAVVPLRPEKKERDEA